MLIEQIDGVDPEPFQRPLDGLFDVLRSAVQTDWMRIFFGVNLETELGRDHHLVTHGSESLAHQLFIHERTVNFSGVEESDAAFDRCPNERNHLLPCPCHCAVTRTQPHAAKPHRRDFKTPCSEIALLHCDYSFVAKSGGAERNGILQFQNSSLPIPKIRSAGLARFPNTADSLPNPVGCPDFVHGLAWRVVPYEKRKSASDKACPEDRLISDGSGDRISQQDRSACSIGRRAFHRNCRFDSLSPNASHGVLSRCCRTQPHGFRTGKETHKPRRDSIPLRSFVILFILDRCSH